MFTTTYLLHRISNYFREAEKFIPERWDEETVKGVPKYAYFPFHVKYPEKNDYLCELIVLRAEKKHETYKKQIHIKQLYRSH